jgi:hypothetical protein
VKRVGKEKAPVRLQVHPAAYALLTLEVAEKEEDRLGIVCVVDVDSLTARALETRLAGGATRVTRLPVEQVIGVSTEAASLPKAAPLQQEEEVLPVFNPDDL